MPDNDDGSDSDSDEEGGEVEEDDGAESDVEDEV